MATVCEPAAESNDRDFESRFPKEAILHCWQLQGHFSSKRVTLCRNVMFSASWWEIIEVRMVLMASDLGISVSAWLSYSNKSMNIYLGRYIYTKLHLSAGF